MSPDRSDPMKAFHTQTARAPIVALSLPPGIRRHPPWPFPAARVRRPPNDIAANARRVIAITARAFLVQQSS